MRKRRGFSMVEVLVSMFLMLLFLSATQVMFVSGYKTMSTGTQTAQMFRSAAIGFDELNRELRLCEALYNPSAASLAAGYAPRQGVNVPLTFRRYDTNWGSEVPVGFTMNDTSHTFIRVIYDPTTFNASHTSTWTVANPATQILTLSLSVQNLDFTYVNNNGVFVQSTMASFPISTVFPLESTVGVKGL